MMLIEYELSRGIMWTFTTPLMLKMYCDVNEIKLQDIDFYYHLISVVINIFIIPFKNTQVFVVLTFIIFCLKILFLKSLYKYKNARYTNLYNMLWAIFMFIYLLDITKLCNPIIIHSLYNTSDTLCKFICNTLISYDIEEEFILRENMDLQSVQFVSHIVKSINNFETNNFKITPFCRNLMAFCKTKFLNKIPKTNDNLKIELLKKYCHSI